MSTLAVVLNLVKVMELFENLLKVMNLSPRKLSASQSVRHCLRGLLTLCLDQHLLICLPGDGRGGQASAVVGACFRSTRDMHTHLGLLTLHALCFCWILSF